MADVASIAVVGGSGFYEFLEDAEEVKLDTPFGAPSDPITVGEVAGRRGAGLPRPGRGPRFSPHKIPYRANMWALRSLGVRRVLAPTAVGSLTPSYGPGTLVIPDQLVDRTSGRAQTFYDEGQAVHVPFADPYCPVGRATSIAAASAAGWDLADSGTLVVIEGPRFSTRAESRWYAAQGWTLVGMTGHPEAVLARELALCYTPIALVTDTDAGIEEGEGVTQDEVFQVFARNVARLRELVMTVIKDLPAERDCPCPHVLGGITLPFELRPRSSAHPVRTALTRPAPRCGPSLVEVPVLDAGEAAFPDKLVEFVLHVHVGRRQGGEHPGHVAHADHAQQFAALDHRQVPDPPDGHLPGRLVQRHVRRHGEHLGGHRLVHCAACRVGTERDGTEHVPLRDDSRQPAALGDEQRPGLLVPHAFRRGTERVRCCLGDRGLCHDIPYLHRAVLLDSPSPPACSHPMTGLDRPARQPTRSARRPVRLGRARPGGHQPGQAPIAQWIERLPPKQ